MAIIIIHIHSGKTILKQPAKEKSPIDTSEQFQKLRHISHLQYTNKLWLELLKRWINFKIQVNHFKHSNFDRSNQPSNLRFPWIKRWRSADSDLHHLHLLVDLGRRVGLLLFCQAIRFLHGSGTRHGSSRNEAFNVTIQKQ